MLVLRELKKRDREKFTKLLIQEFKQKRKQLEARVLHCIRSKGVTILIAIEQVQPQGYLMIHWLPVVWADKPEALVSNLYVAPQSRNRGIGNALLNATVEKARTTGCSRLWLETNRNNPIYEKEFYKKKGWNEWFDLAIFEFPKTTNRKLLLLQR